MFRCTVCDYVHEGPEPPAACPVCGVGPELFERVGAPAAPPVRAARRDGPRIVVLGAGVAGCAAVEAARAQDSAAAITLVGAEEGLPYRRIDLTRLLAGLVTEGDLALHDRAWFERQGVDPIGGRARTLELDGQRVLLADGRWIGFDRLVLATGAHAFVPPWPGTWRAGVSALRDLVQARRILSMARPGARAVVVGGGLLGLEAAAGLAGRGLDVTVLEGQPWLLPRQIPQPAGAVLAEHLGALGVTVVCGIAVRELAGDEDVQAVLLDDGRALPAELVVLSAGIRPNAGLAVRAGLGVGRALRVDSSLRTAHPRVWAVGDLVEVDGRAWGLWGVALEQGRVAGCNAAGGEARFDPPTPVATLKVLDLAVTSVGDFGGDGAELYEERTSGRFLRLVAREGRLAGACLLGHTDLAGPITAAVRMGQPVTSLTTFLAALR